MGSCQPGRFAKVLKYIGEREVHPLPGLRDGLFRECVPRVSALKRTYLIKFASLYE